ncbi:MAG: glycosyltransferase family 4 protein [Phycisphaeraceae bacterium]|nr:glycosyltransferase family 4 protein [Phycisphaerales bacterium]MCB9859777.1 glycosyltransferase family 4 protein [Phycisphaeraceae bacterium]
MAEENGQVQTSMQRPAKIAWLMPSLIEGSGGHRTILQNVAALEARGHECHLYVELKPAQRPSTSAIRKQVIEQLRDYFGYTSPETRVHLGFKIDQPVDLVFATAWYTAKFVRNIQQQCRKAYFVQDYEAWFMPMGDGFLEAERSYQLGLTPISIGRWLTHTLAHKYGCAGTWFDFCADLSVYKRIESIERTPSVCFIFQPEKPRRCPMLGMNALGIVKKQRPDVNIIFYGSRADTKHVWFEHEHRGLVTIEQCNHIYNECQVGLCISSSNPSRIPFEMMAAGLPVVDMHRDNNLYDIPEQGALLTPTKPEAIARGILTLLDDPDRRERMGAFGQQFMKNHNLSVGFEQFVRAVEDLLAGRTQTWSDRAHNIQPMYYRSPDMIGAPLRQHGAHQNGTSRMLGEMIDAQMFARQELARIENSRSYKALTGLKKNPMYAAWARSRYGHNWNHVDLNEDAMQKLQRIKNSRTYRMLMGAKQTGVYRMYAKRKWGEQVANDLQKTK